MMLSRMAARTSRSDARARTKLSRCPAAPLCLHMPQVPSHAHHAPAEPEQDSEHDDENHVLGAEEDEAGQGPAAVVAEEQVPGVAEYQGEQTTEQPLQRAFQEKRTADEPVRGTHQPHDGDL